MTRGEVVGWILAAGSAATFLTALWLTARAPRCACRHRARAHRGADAGCTVTIRRRNAAGTAYHQWCGCRRWAPPDART